VAIVHHFIKALIEGRDPQPDGPEGARTVAACLAAVEASKTGSLVKPARF
jgi:hypothetical protein